MGDRADLGEMISWIALEMSARDERRRVAARLAEMQVDTGGVVKALCDCVGVGWDGSHPRRRIAAMRDRLMWLLVGDGENDECNFRGSESYMDGDGRAGNPAETADDGVESVISDTRSHGGPDAESPADELRECVRCATKTYDNTVWHEMGDSTEDEHTWCSVTVAELEDIACAMDAQVASLRRSAERDADAIESLSRQLEVVAAERDELSRSLRSATLGCDANHRLAKANEGWCDSLVELLRDAAREYQELQGNADAERVAYAAASRRHDACRHASMELPRDMRLNPIRVGAAVTDGLGHMFDVIGVGSGTFFWRDRNHGGHTRIKEHAARNVYVTNREGPDEAESMVRAYVAGEISESELAERIRGALSGRG